MDPKLQQLVSRTNLNELLQPAAPEVDLNQPVDTAQPAPLDPPRSTVDPFQVNFATTDIVGKLQDTRSSGVKTFALIFLGGPMAVFGIALVFMAFSNPEVGMLRRVFAITVGSALAGFWPYLIFKRRRR